MANKFKKLIKNKKVLYIVCSLVLVMVIAITYLLVIKFSDYKFSMTLNGESYKFFVGETLYYKDDVKIASDLNGYKVYINKKKSNGNVTLKEGTYHIEYKKHLKKLSFDLEIDKTPSIYVEDYEGNEIHNYLSNTKSFKIIHDEEIKIDYSVYDDSTISEPGNYLVRTSDREYNINILEAF